MKLLNQQGDVLLKQTNIPNNAKETNETILAYGEVTGHAHRLYGNGFKCFRMPDKEGSELPSFKLKIDENGNRFLKVLEPTMLKHQEHDRRVIPPGIYKIGIQREYDPFSKLIRKVID